MKTKIFMSLMVVAMVAALIGGATMAWFTDSDASAPVTFTAGTLLIDIDNLHRSDSNEMVKIENLNPGDEFEYKFDVVNVGTKNFVFTGLLCYQDVLGNQRVDFPEGKEYGISPLSEVLEVELSVEGATWVVPGKNWDPGVFYKGTLAAYDNNSDPYGAYPDSLANFIGQQQPKVFGEADLNSGDSLTYKVKYLLPEETNNDYQGSSMNVAFVVMAKQWQDGAVYGDFQCPLFPSTNAWNKHAENPSTNQNIAGKVGPHVNLLGATVDSVTLEFNMPLNYNAYFEYRVDGQPVNPSTLPVSNPAGHEFGDPHPNPLYYIAANETIHGIVAVNNSTQTVTFNNVTDNVEVRLAIGGEREWDFDWTPFSVK